MSTKGFELNLKSDAFNSFKSDFDSMLKHTLYTMQQKEGEEAQISITFKITLAKDTAPDHEITAYEAERDVIIPKIDHKMKSKITIQDEKSGTVGGPKFELVWDPEEHEYVMRKIEDGNLRLFDSDELDNATNEDQDDATDDTTAEDDGTEFVCEIKQAGNCKIIDDCGVCCKECDDPVNCLNICTRCLDREKEIVPTETQDESDPVEVPELSDPADVDGGEE